jgi:hypothetical protein
MTPKPALPLACPETYQEPNDDATPSIDGGANLTLLDEHIDDCGTAKINCPDQSVVSFYDQNDGRLHLFLCVCKRWTCPYCGRVKRAKLEADIKTARPNRFVTLTTCGHESESPRQIFDWTRRQISELAKVIRREGRDFEYLRALEATKTGYPHYHLLVRSPYLDQKELSRHWCHFTRAYIVDIRSLTKDEAAAKYVMKYLTKQHSISFTQRRLSWTRNFFPKRDEDTPSTYAPINVTRTRGSLEDYKYWNGHGAEFEAINRWHWIRKEQA